MSNNLLKIISVAGRKAICECECGNIKEYWMYDIERGRVKSCGCLRYKILTDRNTTHGESRTRLYRIYRGMVSRCHIKSSSSYKNYGHRGISVCNEWRNEYEVFRNWAMSNGYEDNLTIERIDVNGNYCPANCKWIPKSEQHLNKRNANTFRERDDKGRFVSTTKSTTPPNY